MIFKSTLFHLKEIGSIRHRKYTCTDVSSDESLLLFFRTICVFENNKDRTLCNKCFNQEYTNALEYWRLQWQTHKISTRYLDSKIINDKINAAIICVNKNDELKTLWWDQSMMTVMSAICLRSVMKKTIFKKTE